MKLRKSKKMTARQRELNRSWNAILEKYPTKHYTISTYKEPEVYRRETPNIPSHGVKGVADCTKKESPVYTGTNMLGIAQMSKSNAIPVFDPTHILEISKMRR